VAGFVADLGIPVVSLLAPQSGERILDLGCGDGVLTQKLMAAGASVLGIDTSPEQIAAARRAGVDAQVLDARDLAFPPVFDAVFTNAALHWMKRPEAVIAGVARALRRGGRFVGEMGGAGNVAAVVAALSAALARRGVAAGPLNPWFFPTAEEFSALLRGNGFVIDSIEIFARPTALPTRLADWLDTFAEAFLRAVPATERGGLKDDVEAFARAALQQQDGSWVADYVRLRFRATKP
jgi:SAM-dependent methyltransferase